MIIYIPHDIPIIVEMNQEDQHVLDGFGIHYNNNAIKAQSIELPVDEMEHVLAYFHYLIENTFVLEHSQYGKYTIVLGGRNEN